MMTRSEFLTLGAGTLLAGCANVQVKMPQAKNYLGPEGFAPTAAAKPVAGDPRLRGPFPIMTMAYHADGGVDYDSLVREARFVADSGCPGVIWCQSNDAVDLLTFEEKKRGYAALAEALQGREIMLTLGCNGVDRAQMLREAAAVEEVAAKYPKTNIAIISRPPDTGKTLEDIRAYYEALAQVAKRPVIIQTWVNKTCPAPTVELLVELAKRHPAIYGYIKEESEGDKANDRMVAENKAKPAIHTVFSAWGGWQWLYQSRRCGSEGLITERCAYAPLLAYIWRQMEKGDPESRLTEAFAFYRLLIDQRGFPRGDMGGYALHYFKRLGIFTTTWRRQYKKAKVETQGTVAEGDDAHSWTLVDLKLSSAQIAELDRCYDDMQRYLARVDAKTER